jgi:hypothetical protein
MCINSIVVINFDYTMLIGKSTLRIEQKFNFLELIRFFGKGDRNDYFRLKSAWFFMFVVY